VATILGTSLLFLAAVAAAVAYLTVTRRDQTELLRPGTD
jgi:hypothetical protein